MTPNLDLHNHISDLICELHDGSTGTEQECTVILGLLAQWHRQLEAAGIIDDDDRTTADDVLRWFREVYTRTRHFRIAAHRFLQSLKDATI